MKRTSSHIFKFATGFKQQKLEDLFVEYQRVVNEFIDLFWDETKLPSKINSGHYKQIESWLLGKAMKCAGNQAIKIIKSTRKKDKQLTYKCYKRVFSKAKQKNKNWDLVTQRWSEWSKDKKFRHRLNKPVYTGDSIELNSDLVHIQDPKKSTEFDLWIRLGSIFGNRFSLILPTRKHSQYNKLKEQGFETKKSVRLRKYNGNYYVDLFHEKADFTHHQSGKVVGIDVGINKLMSTSENEFHGEEIKSKINKLNNRKHGSKNYKQTCDEIKHYINTSINQLDWENMSAIVLEDIKNITKNTKGRINKTTRKLLGHWNLNHLTNRIKERCEVNRVHFDLVPPAYTSQKCSSCGAIHKESRLGELYDCLECGNKLDADYNASLNIRNLFLNKEPTVPYEQKQENLPLVDFGNFN
jgi:IS605 OrfB family transposase